MALASGLLSGQFHRDTQFANTDHRNYNRDGQKFNVGETFSGLPFEKGLEFVENLKNLLPGEMPQSALRWILDFEAVTVVIPGSKNPQQVLNNCNASSCPPLTPATHKDLSRFYSANVASQIRGKY